LEFHSSTVHTVSVSDGGQGARGGVAGTCALQTVMSSYADLASAPRALVPRRAVEDLNETTRGRRRAGQSRRRMYPWSRRIALERAERLDAVDARRRRVPSGCVAAMACCSSTASRSVSSRKMSFRPTFSSVSASSVPQSHTLHVPTISSSPSLEARRGGSGVGVAPLGGASPLGVCPAGGHSGNRWAGGREADR
jgi:hypothetical protein